MLGLLGLRIFEATGTDVGDLGEEHGHRVRRVVGKGSRVVLVPLPPPWGAPSTAPSTAEIPGRSCATPAARGWTATPEPAGRATSQQQPASGCPECTRTCPGTRS